MRDEDLRRHISSVACRHRRLASRCVFAGGASPFDNRVIARCRSVDAVTATRICFTRDVGYHSSGWWKNPDFERCLHLSLSPTPSSILTRAELSRETQRLWVEAFFRGETRRTWAEPAFTPAGKAAGVWHFRLFCDEGWQPITPRGEVYSRELTEAGWKSTSELLYATESEVSP